MKKDLIYTKPIIHKNKHKFIRVSNDLFKLFNQLDQFRRKNKCPGELIYWYDKRKLIAFADTAIGWEDYKATYGEVSGWNSAYYVREDYMYILDTKIEQHKLNPLEDAMTKAFDNLFKKDAIQRSLTTHSCVNVHQIHTNGWYDGKILKKEKK